MRVLRSPVAQFLAAGAVTLVLVLLATGRLSARAASQEAIDDAVSTTSVLARSVAEPALPRRLVAGDPGAVDRFDRAVLSRLLVRDVRRIKIWAADGTIVYSDETRLIGQRYELGDDERRVLADGTQDAERSDLGKPENRFEPRGEGLLEVYTRIRSPEGQPLLFEAYYSARDVAARRQQVFGAFRPITVGGLLALLALTTPLVWVLTRRVDAAARERERLLQAAVRASDAERRRIARDLHDTVVQDLAGTAFALAASARDARTAPAPPSVLDGAAAEVRRSMRSLRSLLVEIHPPDLRTVGLHAALQDLLAPAAGVGIEADVITDGIEDLPDDTVALVWRVAQEAARNALRHAQARQVSVTVSGGPRRVCLKVRDDGSGFDLADPADEGHFGLHGMTGLVQDAGGRLEVRSAPGAGTTVTVELPLGARP